MCDTINYVKGKFKINLNVKILTEIIGCAARKKLDDASIVWQLTN